MSKLTAKTATTNAGRDALVHVVITPSGTPASRKMTIKNFFKSNNGNDSVLDSASLSAAIATIGTTPTTLEIPASMAVTASMTIPENVVSVISGVGEFNVSSGQTLTINGPIIAPLRQIFTGLGSVVIGSRIERVYPQWWGAKGDSRHVDDAAMTNASPTLTSATAAFTTADVGKTVVVKGAGASGVPLITTISGYTNATTVTLSASASTTVSAKRVIIGTNDSTPIAAAHASGAKCVHLAKSNYLVRMTATGGGAVSIPSGMTLQGDGAGSVVYVIGSDGKDVGNADDDGKAAFYIADGTKKVTVEGIKFVGENGPYTEPAQNQSNVIYLPGTGSGTEDVLITRCYFDDLFGFSVHCGGELAHRVHVTHSTFKNNANGLNVNADYSNQCWNTFDHCEGLEASGAYGNYSDNIFNDCGMDSHASAAMSLGGRTSVGSWGLGCVVARNRVIASRSAGIVLSDGFVEGECIDNYIIKAYALGIQQVQSSGNDIERNLIARNTVISCGNSGSGNPYGIFIAHGEDTKVIDNVVMDRGIASYATTYAFLDTATRTFLENNTASGTNKDFALNGTDTQFGMNNIYDRAKIENFGTIKSPVFRGERGLANNTVTGIFEVALPTVTAASGTINYRIWNAAGGDVQIRSGVVRFSAVNKAGVYTSEIVVVDEAASNSAGTLTGTWSIVTGTNKVIIKVNANSSIFGSLIIDFTFQNESFQAITLV